MTVLREMRMSSVKEELTHMLMTHRHEFWGKYGKYDLDYMKLCRMALASQGIVVLCHPEAEKEAYTAFEALGPEFAEDVCFYSSGKIHNWLYDFIQKYVAADDFEYVYDFLCATIADFSPIWVYFLRQVSAKRHLNPKRITEISLPILEKLMVKDKTRQYYWYEGDVNTSKILPNVVNMRHLERHWVQYMGKSIFMLLLIGMLDHTSLMSETERNLYYHIIDPECFRDWDMDEERLPILYAANSSQVRTYLGEIDSIPGLNSRMQIDARKSAICRSNFSYARRYYFTHADHVEDILVDYVKKDGPFLFYGLCQICSDRQIRDTMTFMNRNHIKISGFHRWESGETVEEADDEPEDKPSLELEYLSNCAFIEKYCDHLLDILELDNYRESKYGELIISLMARYVSAKKLSELETKDKKMYRKLRTVRLENGMGTG